MSEATAGPLSRVHVSHAPGRLGLPGRARPAGALPDRRRRGQERRRTVVLRRARQDPRHRRRVRLGQERHQPVHHGAAHPAAVRVSRRGLAGRRRPGAGHRRAGAPAARPEDGDDLPGPALLDAPVLHGRPPDHRGLPDPQRRDQGGRPQARDRHARPGRHPPAELTGRRLPAPVLRRHAAARDDRDGVVLQPRAADRGRADDGARRHRAGADPGPDPGPAAGVQLRGHHHHPRPRCGGRAGRRHPGDVRRAGRGVRLGRRHLPQPAAPLHVGPARLDAPAGPRAVRAAAADQGPAAEPDQRAVRLPVPSALRVRGTQQRRQPSERPEFREVRPGHFIACHLDDQDRRTIWETEIRPNL